MLHQGIINVSLNITVYYKLYDFVHVLDYL